MDGKGRDGTCNFFLTTTGGVAGGQGIGHRGAAAPLPPYWRRPCWFRKFLIEPRELHGYVSWVNPGHASDPIAKSKSICV